MKLAPDKSLFDQSRAAMGADGQPVLERLPTFKNSLISTLTVPVIPSNVVALVLSFLAPTKV